MRPGSSSSVSTRIVSYLDLVYPTDKHTDTLARRRLRTMLRRIPTSALKAPGRRSLVSLTSSARPTVNPNSSPHQNASTTSSSLSASAKMFEFDVKSVAGEMRKRGLTSAATRDAGMDRVSSEDRSFRKWDMPFHPNDFAHVVMSPLLLFRPTPSSLVSVPLLRQCLLVSLSIYLPAGHHRPSPLLSGISS